MSIYSKIDLKGAEGEEYDGSVTNRFERDYEFMANTDTAGIPDDRKGRQLDEQSIERQGRLYVDRETLISATGKDAKIVANEYGASRIDQPSMERPSGAVQSYDEAADKDLVPAKGDHVVPYRYAAESESEAPVTPPVDPETEE